MEQQPLLSHKSPLAVLNRYINMKHMYWGWPLIKMNLEPHNPLLSPGL